MIMIWNRKEVFVGHSLQKFNEVCDILAGNKIKYKYKIVNHNSTYAFGSSRATRGTFGENMDYSNMYYIYVHKKDYDYVCSVLQNFKF